MARTAEAKQGKSDEIGGWRDRWNPHPVGFICLVKDFRLYSNNNGQP